MYLFLSLTLFSSVVIQILWIYFYDTSFLTINLLISLPVPGIVQLMQAVFLNLLYFDIFYTEKWLPQMFQFDPFEDEESGLNEYFEDNGFGTTLFMVNLGSALVFMMVHLALFLIYPLLHWLAKYLN
jgi:hypothetical protein